MYKVKTLKKYFSTKPVDGKAMLLENPYQPSPINSLVVEGNQENGIAIRNDVDALLMQQDYISRHPEMIEDFLRASAMNSAKPDALSDLKKGLTDNELIQFIKPRRIQSPQELKMYSDYLMEEYAGKKEEFDSLVKQTIGKDKLDSELEAEHPELKPTPSPVPLVPSSPKTE